MEEEASKYNCNDEKNIEIKPITAASGGHKGAVGGVQGGTLDYDHKVTSFFLSPVSDVECHTFDGGLESQCDSIQTVFRISNVLKDDLDEVANANGLESVRTSSSEIAALPHNAKESSSISPMNFGADTCSEPGSKSAWAELEISSNNDFTGGIHTDELFLDENESGNPKRQTNISAPNLEGSSKADFSEIQNSPGQSLSIRKEKNLDKNCADPCGAKNVAPVSVVEVTMESDAEKASLCPSISSSAQSSAETTPQHLQTQIESNILSKLNEVLSNLGFGIKKGSENHVNGACADINLGDGMCQRVDSSSSTLHEFTSSLQYQLSKFKLASEKFRDDHYSEVQGLERAFAQERSRWEQQETLALQTITQLKNDLEKKHQLFESANKDKEGMVVKYAMSEKSLITVKKDLEQAERRLREANRARDLLSDRLKTVQSEKERANNLLETKGQEFSILNRENQRLKEDLRWTQNKLKTESENKREADQRITDLIRKVEESRLEAEQAHKDAQNAIKSFQASEENKAVSLDHQLREQHAKLILERYEKDGTQVVMKQLQAEVDSLKTKQQALINENNQLSLKVQTLEKERLEGDQKLSRLKQESDLHHQEVADLRERLAGMESLRAQLQQYEDQLSTCRNEMERLRQTNMEHQQDAEACRKREAELLDFTQKLTEKNVRLQSEFSALEARAQMLESEQKPLTRKLGEAETRVMCLSKELAEEQKKRQEENSILARHLAESTHHLEQTQQQLEDCQGEIEVLKRKHAASIRELTREIQQSRKRQEMAENMAGTSHHSSNSSTSIAQGSRTSSSSSLNTVCDPTPSPALPPITFPNGQEPDKQVLIERLVKLQRENTKKAEKLDFMEEHSQVLVNELQKKTRLIQNFVLKMPAGALSSESMDQNKHAIAGFSKMKQADLAKKTGIMASMYGTKNDDNMSIELSMEINRKLQAVLEDTLLKNITLKENIDTLGAEIARLSTKPLSK